MLFCVGPSPRALSARSPPLPRERFSPWVDLTRSPSRRRTAGLCAKPPFVMVWQRSLHHRSNQTRNRHGWRCPAQRKLRLGARQYGERYLWFESISLHHAVPENRGGFLVHRNSRNFGRLPRRSAVSSGFGGFRPGRFGAFHPGFAGFHPGFHNRFFNRNIFRERLSGRVVRRRLVVAGVRDWRGRRRGRYVSIRLCQSNGRSSALGAARGAQVAIRPRGRSTRPTRRSAFVCKPGG